MELTLSGRGPVSELLHLKKITQKAFPRESEEISTTTSRQKEFINLYLQRLVDIAISVVVSWHFPSGAPLEELFVVMALERDGFVVSVHKVVCFVAYTHGSNVSQPSSLNKSRE